MDTKIIVVGIVIALVLGAGAGYTLSPKTSQNLELRNAKEHKNTRKRQARVADCPSEHRK